MIKILKYKPDVKEQSINLYLRSLKIIYQEIYDRDGEPDNIDFLGEYDKVLNYLDTRNINTKKNYLTAIVVAIKAYGDTKKLNTYYPIFLNLIEKIKEQTQSQEKTEKEKLNWESLKNLKSVLENYKKQLTSTGVFNLDWLRTQSSASK